MVHYVYVCRGLLLEHGRLLLQHEVELLGDGNDLGVRKVDRDEVHMEAREHIPDGLGNVRTDLCT